MNSETAMDEKRELRYPRSVFPIIVNELCERFSFYALRTILVLYFEAKLLLSPNDSTVLFHAFNMTCYMFPVIGGIISDSWLGKYRTILYLSLVYAVGNIVVALSSYTALGLPALPMTCLGLLLIGAGTGGIKPCVASFGGDQFVLPAQSRQLAGFFSLFYFIINLGGFLGTLITPEIRTQSCLGEDTCYPLAFALPAVLMLLFCGVFVAAKRTYVMKNPDGNVLVQICRCMWTAARNRKEGAGRAGHWLDAAEGRFDKQLIADTKVLLRLFLLAVPLPVFWALFDMQGSRWTIQAQALDGTVGGWTIKPDQMQLAGLVLVLVLLPVFEAWLHPALRRCGLLATPLQRMSVGGLMAAAAYICAGILQLQVQQQGAGNVHMFWQIPQFFFIALSDIWFAIAVLEFGFREAPVSMKSSITALFLLTTAVGDIIVMVITGADMFSDRAVEFFVYAGLMVAVMVVFIYLTSQYKYVDDTRSELDTKKGRRTSTE